MTFCAWSSVSMRSDSMQYAAPDAAGKRRAVSEVPLPAKKVTAVQFPVTPPKDTVQRPGQVRVCHYAWLCLIVNCSAIFLTPSVYAGNFSRSTAASNADSSASSATDTATATCPYVHVYLS